MTLISILTLVLNLLIIPAYTLLAYASYKTIKLLKDKRQYSILDLKRLLADVFRLSVPKLRTKLFERDKGWLAVYIGISSILTSSAIFGLLHLEFLLDLNIEDLGFSKSIRWFLTHILGIFGSALLVYGAYIGIKNGKRFEEDA